MTQDEQDELAKTIKVLVEKADRAKQKAEEFLSPPVCTSSRSRRNTRAPGLNGRCW